MDTDRNFSRRRVNLDRKRELLPYGPTLATLLKSLTRRAKGLMEKGFVLVRLKREESHEG